MGIIINRSNITICRNSAKSKYKKFLPAEFKWGGNKVTLNYCTLKNALKTVVPLALQNILPTRPKPSA